MGHRKNWFLGAIVAVQAVPLTTGFPRSEGVDDAIAPTLFESQSRELVRRATELSLAPSREVRAPAGVATKPARFVSRFVAAETRRRMRKTSSARVARETAKAIVGEANRRGVDPLLLMAIIEHESGFRPHARGRHGEIGLMQIRPESAAWIASRAGLPYEGPEQLKNPIFNIRLGAAYVGFLRARLNGPSLQYLSAYNMGAGAVRAKLKLGTKPKIYVAGVLGRYQGLRSRLNKEAALLPRHRTRVDVAANSAIAPTVAGLGLGSGL